MVAKHSEENTEGQMQLSEDYEEDLCKVWDMAMNKVQFLISISIYIFSPWFVH